MSKVICGKLAQAPGRHEPIRALLRAGHNDAAIVQLCPIVVTDLRDLVARELLFDAFFQKREWTAALALAEELVGRRPDIPASRRPASRRFRT